MSLSGRSVARASRASLHQDQYSQQGDDTSPPVSRAEVLEVFESWKHSASIAGRSDDSGIEQTLSSQSDQQSIANQPANKTKANKVNKQANKRNNNNRYAKGNNNNKKKAAHQATDVNKSSSSSSDSSSVRSANGSLGSNKVMNHAGGKLPRIGLKKTSRQSTLRSLNSPPSHAQQQQAPPAAEEKRRFINVVRPLSVFPDPELPPNYIPPVLSQQHTSSNSNQYPDFSPMQHHAVPPRRPPSPAPFHRQRANRLGGANFSLAGQGVSGYGDNAPGSATLKMNLAGGSGWDLTAIKRGYNAGSYQGAAPRNLNGGYKSLQERDTGIRYQSQNALDQEEKISMPPWNPHFGYNKVLSQQNLPLTDDWRRHIDARRKALQRRRTKRRGLNEGSTSFGTNGDRYYNGSVQTDGNFEELLRRAGDVESSVQTETAIDNVKRKPDSYTQDNSTQVVLSDLPGYESELLPIVEQLVNGTLEQAFTEMLEEEEIKAIRQQRIQFQQMKLAEMTTSRLMNTLNE